MHETSISQSRLNPIRRVTQTTCSAEFGRRHINKQRQICSIVELASCLSA